MWEDGEVGRLKAGNLKPEKAKGCGLQGLSGLGWTVVVSRSSNRARARRAPTSDRGTGRAQGAPLRGCLGTGRTLR